MPIYEYRRPDGTTFELQQSFSDDPLTVDPDTGVAVQRVLHPPAVHFKGSGFYNTDYGTRKRQRETAAAAEKSSAGKSSADKGSAEKGSVDKSSTTAGSTAEKSSSTTAGDGAGTAKKPSESKPASAKS